MIVLSCRCLAYYPRSALNRPSRGSCADLEAALGKVDRKNVNVSHVLLLLQRNVAPVRHHTMPGEGGIHPISSFASVATRYKQGGLQVATPPFPDHFGPKAVINYELGLKGRLFGNAFNYRAAVYLKNYKDLQIFQFVAATASGRLLTTNPGAARIYGLEFEADWRRSPVDRVSSYITYNLVRFTKFDNSIDPPTNAVIQTLARNQLGHAPDW